MSRTARLWRAVAESREKERFRGRRRSLPALTEDDDYEEKSAPQESPRSNSAGNPSTTSKQCRVSLARVVYNGRHFCVPTRLFRATTRNVPTLSR